MKTVPASDQPCGLKWGKQGGTHPIPTDKEIYDNIVAFFVLLYS